VPDPGCGAQVGAERRLTVGSRRHEVEPPARAEEAGAEAGHDVSPLVFERHRWHRDENVVREKGHERVEIGGPAMAAEEALTRVLSAELAPHGIRVVGLRPQAIPETGTLKEAFEARAKLSGMTWEQFQESLASRNHARRLMTLAEMANMAVFMASDQASGMTGTIVNLTMGSLDD
jgi:NAD(P)-dependent dehydrogenase (short-subunit alcohol dehydrogenase family)